MAILFGLAAVLATFLGGLFALKKQDRLHLILGFSAGAVIGVAFFDLLPEAFDLTNSFYSSKTVSALVAAGFLLFMFLNRFVEIHPHSHDEDLPESQHHHLSSKSGNIGAGTLSIHSFLDGLGIGLAFQISSSVGLVVAIAVLAHDFSDGINTVSYILKHQGEKREALKWLTADALAPLLGVITASFMTLPSKELGLVLAIFCGFFLYIGASDLLPESQHLHPKLETSLMTILGAFLIYLVTYLAAAV